LREADLGAAGMAAAATGIAAGGGDDDVDDDVDDDDVDDGLTVWIGNAIIASPADVNAAVVQAQSAQ